MIVLHGSWLLDRDIVPFWPAIFVLLRAGRLWVIASLGRRWTTRVIVPPRAAPVARGLYRWLKHPNYLVVALEIVVVPLAPGLPVFALIFSIANVALELYRIRSKTRRWPGLRSRREH